MEQDVVLAPSAIWMRALRPNLQKIVDTKLSSNKTYRAAETSVTVHVSDRAERDLTKRFDGLDIDWAVLENQLVAWSRLFRAGKRLRLTMEFKYIEVGDISAGDRRRSGRNKNSTTEQMLSERSTEINTAANPVNKTGEWSRVYNLIRCPNPSCQPAVESNVHYPLLQHHIRDLVRYAQKGRKLETHGNVPHIIREQLKATTQNVSNHKRKRDESPVRALPPININVSSSPHAADTSGIWATEPLGPKNVERLNIPGLREDILQYYTI
ncbi:hypothetical protein BKA67DRAFT_679527 [Truncatella angustata]|uniref:Uncharacterized protein n=1 Tax=Truncatella angustata TaxID=152316 RepID=A0A9P8ZY37_9PEZI|nr:uncharacterized protein BKA67DRAFT_679527 [Truncatella angustata]KAH6653643.1 hypothetical protein BKA67DRAFT_679527 [Truncatella angustata]